MHSYFVTQVGVCICCYVASVLNFMSLIICCHHDGYIHLYLHKSLPTYMLACGHRISSIPNLCTCCYVSIVYYTTCICYHIYTYGYSGNGW